MKNRIFSLLLLISSLFLATSCLDDEYLYDFENQKPVIELPYVNHSMTLSYMEGTESVSTPLYVNYSIADWRDINEEIPVVVDIDESLLPEGSLLLPQSSYNLTFPLTMTIKKASDVDSSDRGEESGKLNNQSAMEMLTINLKDANLVVGETYALPVRIVSAPSQYTVSGNFNTMVFQVTINFICAMQFNTFRQAENIPMATTFVTNHVRQTGSYLVRWLRKKDEKTYLFRSMRHFCMIAMFVIGAMLATMLCVCFHDQAILFALIVLGFVFVDLVRADLIEEKELLNKVPGGH